MSFLPDLAESWNWAHTQIAGDTPLAQALASAPGTVISRLICPRRLDPETGYTAFLVPAFDIGVQAGTGQTPASGASANPAWTTRTQGPISLPYYYKFQFHTSDAGDFESLVRALTPVVLPATVGERMMDVSQPGRASRRQTARSASRERSEASARNPRSGAIRQRRNSRPRCRPSSISPPPPSTIRRTRTRTTR